MNIPLSPCMHRRLMYLVEVGLEHDLVKLVVPYKAHCQDPQSVAEATVNKAKNPEQNLARKNYQMFEKILSGGWCEPPEGWSPGQKEAHKDPVPEEKALVRTERVVTALDVDAVREALSSDFQTIRMDVVTLKAENTALKEENAKRYSEQRQRVDYLEKEKARLKEEVAALTTSRDRLLTTVTNQGVMLVESLRGVRFLKRELSDLLPVQDPEEVI